MKLEDVYLLPLDDRFTYLIGRLARDSVNLEIALRWCLAAFDGENGEWPESPRPFSQVLEVCKRRVKAESSDVIRGAALDALEHARRAYDGRSRYVHDVLRESATGVADEPERVRLTANGLSAEDRSVTISLESLQYEIERTTHAVWRLRALRQCTLDPRSERTHWLGILQGKGETNWDRTLDWSR